MLGKAKYVLSVYGKALVELIIIDVGNMPKNFLVCYLICKNEII